MGCFESKYSDFYDFYDKNLVNSIYTKSKHECSKEFKNYLSKKMLDFEYYSIGYQSYDTCLCKLYIKCYICNKKHINFNTVYCSICKKCVINNLYYHCYNCNKCKPIFIDHCENIKKYM